MRRLLLAILLVAASCGAAFAAAAPGPNAVWRVRAGGATANGGGYDSTISGALSTTLNGSIQATGNIVVASAAGWPSSGNYYARIGPVGAEPGGNGTAGQSEVVQ